MMLEVVHYVMHVSHAIHASLKSNMKVYKSKTAAPIAFIANRPSWGQKSLIDKHFQHGHYHIFVINYYMHKF